MTPQEFKQHRQSLGLTHDQIAPMLGYSHKTRISEIENAKTSLTDTVARLMQAYVDGYRPKDWPIS